MSAALAALTLVLAAPVGASGALTQAQRACVAKYDNGLRKLTRLADAAFARCLARHARGRLGGSTLSQCLQTPDARLDAALAGVAATLARKCEGVDGDGVTKTPGFGTTEPPSALDLATIAVSGIFLGATATFGEDLDEVLADFATDEKLARCQLTVSRRQAGCRQAYLAAFVSCARRGLAGRGTPPFADAAELATCVGSDPQGTVAALCDPAAGRIGRGFAGKCVGRGIDPARAVPACAEAGPTAVECIARTTLCEACRTVSDAADLDPAPCAAHCGPP